jgi:hypothetical protein
MTFTGRAAKNRVSALLSSASIVIIRLASVLVLLVGPGAVAV